MPAQPHGLVMPADGRLPEAALAAAVTRAFSVYIHVPFCAVRCGYCDFNTYTLASMGPVAVRDWLGAAHREIDLARKVLPADIPAISTVFFGGGTPSLIPAKDLGGLLAHLKAEFGLAADAEITAEANPETLDASRLGALLVAGINRLSIGMQSASPQTLRTLERVHTPGGALASVAEAHRAGFGKVSLDLIYGTPGESLESWLDTLTAAITAQPEHLSAYALVIEEATAMGQRLARGEIAPVNEDLQAEMYLAAEENLAQAGYANYEISNWAKPGHEARHNMAYWLGHHWWGVGPGAHSHIAGVRWWNVKSPVRYAQLLAEGRSPGAAREILNDDQRRIERVLLELRLASGLPLGVLSPAEQTRVPDLIKRGMAYQEAGCLILTTKGKLLADGLIAELLD